MTTLRRTFVVAFALFSAACGDSGKFKELVGTYDVTTTLNTYTYTIPGADCSTGVSNCRRTDPANGATLTGTMTISGGGSEELGVVTFNLTGAAQGSWCTTLEVTGCSGMGAYSITYPGSFVQASDLRIDARLDEAGTGGSVAILSAGELENNKLVGTITVSQPGTAILPNLYAGTFVATKR
jgi:hypothetical protein